MFQLWSHAHLYADDSEDNFKSRRFPNQPSTGKGTAVATDGGGASTTRRGDKEGSVKSGGELNPPSTFENSPDVEKQESSDAEEGEEVPQLSVVMSLVTLVVVTVVCLTNRRRTNQPTPFISWSP